MSTPGRPSKYTKELGDKICFEIATSCKGLRKVCEDNEEFPSYSTVYNWLRDDTNKEFLNSYTRAREDQADFLAEEMLEIADFGINDTYIDDKGNVRVNEDVIARSRLRVDTRKFLASKLKPKKYGDKLDLTSKGDKINNTLDLSGMTFEQLRDLANGNRPTDQASS